MVSLPAKAAALAGGCANWNCIILGKKVANPIITPLSSVPEMVSIIHGTLVNVSFNMFSISLRDFP